MPVIANNHITTSNTIELIEKLRDLIKDPKGLSELKLLKDEIEKNIEHIEENKLVLTSRDFRATLLIRAAYLNITNLLKFLIKYELVKGVINHVDLEHGSSAIMFAAQAGHKDTVTLLYQNGADLYLRSKQDKNTLFFAFDSNHEGTIEFVWRQSSQAQQEKTLKEVIYPDFGTTQFLLACHQGKLHAAKFLLEQDPTLIDRPNQKFCETPLDTAAFSNDKDTLEFVWRKSSHAQQEKSLNEVIFPNPGNTLFMHACLKGLLNTIKVLLEHDPSLINKPNQKDDLTPLDLAAFSNDKDTLEFVWSKAPQAQQEKSLNNVIFPNTGDTLFMYACLKGLLNTIKVLLEHDPSLIDRSNQKFGHTPLDLAALSNDKDTLDFVWRKSTQAQQKKSLNDVIFPNPGNTLFMHACLKGLLNTIKVLLEHDPSLINKSNQKKDLTPLDLAAFSNDKDTLEFVWRKSSHAQQEKSLNEVIFPNPGNTLFMHACLKGLLNTIKVLLEHDPSLINKPNQKDDLTPLDLAAFSNDKDTLKFVWSKAPQAQQEKSLNKVIFPNTGDTLFMYACLKGLLNTIKVLLEHDPSLINKTNQKDGLTSLDLAALSNDKDTLEFLWEKSSQTAREKLFNAVAYPNTGKTLFMQACRKGLLNTIKFLLEHNPSLINKPNQKDSLTPLDLAALSNDKDTLEFIWSKSSQEQQKKSLNDVIFSNAVNTLFMQACLEGFLNTIKFLLEKDPSLINKPNQKDDLTPLDLAAFSNDKDTLEFIWSKSSQEQQEKLLNKVIFPNMGKTLFMYACLEGRLNTIKVLLEKDPSLINKPNQKDGYTPLDLAAFSNDKDTLEFIWSESSQAQQEKSLNNVIFPNTGNTLFMQACLKGRLNTIKVLLDQDSTLIDRPNQKDSLTPLDLAAFSNDKDTLKFIWSKSSQEQQKKYLNEFIFPINGNTPFMQACITGKLNTIEFLLDQDSTLIDRTNQQDGLTPLDLAAFSSDKDTLEFVWNKSNQTQHDKLLKGVNAYDNKTIFLRQCERGELSTIKFLLEKDPSIRHQKISSRWNALDIISNINHPHRQDFAMVLLSYGLKPHAHGEYYSVSEELHTHFKIFFSISMQKINNRNLLSKLPLDVAKMIAVLFVSRNNLDTYRKIITDYSPNKYRYFCSDRVQSVCGSNDIHEDKLIEQLKADEHTRYLNDILADITTCIADIATKKMRTAAPISHQPSSRQLTNRKQDIKVWIKPHLMNYLKENPNGYIDKSLMIAIASAIFTIDMIAPSKMKINIFYNVENETKKAVGRAIKINTQIRTLVAVKRTLPKFSKLMSDLIIKIVGRLSSFDCQQDIEAITNKVLIDHLIAYPPEKRRKITDKAMSSMPNISLLAHKRTVEGDLKEDPADSKQENKRQKVLAKPGRVEDSLASSSSSSMTTFNERSTSEFFAVKNPGQAPLKARSVEYNAKRKHATVETPDEIEVDKPKQARTG